MRLHHVRLTNGLNQLSLEVTISCAILMLTLHLVKWGLSSLPSGESIVRRQLQIRLRIKYFKELKPTLKDEDTKALYCVEEFDKAIESTASDLVSDCYSAAWSVFSEFLGFLSAIAFLFYYMFKEGIPEDVSSLMIIAIVCAPVWLLIVLVVGPVRRSSKANKAKVKEAKSRAEGGGSTTSTGQTLKYKTAYSGILWTCVYILWAFGPILINPLKNRFGPGTNFVPLTDLLTASKQQITLVYTTRSIMH